MVTTRRRRFSALVATGLLTGAFMAVVVVNPMIRSASADVHAVVPNSSIAGFTPTAFPANDDGTYPSTANTGGTRVPLGFDINYFGTKYSGAFVNNNGNLTFDSALSAYTPFGLDSANRVIIAPFFADVDTRNGNTAQFGTGTYNGHKVFVVNWPGVRCFENSAGTPSNSVLDNFQVIISDRADRVSGTTGDDFDIEFNYDTIQWDTGHSTQSGGDALCSNPTNVTNAAVVGYSDGTAPHSYQLPGSQSANAFLDSNPTTGLVNNSIGSTVLGRYHFNVHNGQPLVPPTVTSTPTAASVTAGVDTAWTVNVVNNNDAPLTNVSATLHATANGSTPLAFHNALMPGCGPDDSGNESCPIPDIPAHSNAQLNVFVPSTGLGGATIDGTATVSSTDEPDVTSTLGPVAVSAVVVPHIAPLVTADAISPSVTNGEDAAWTVTVVNRDGSPLTGGSATLSATSGTSALTFDGARMPGCVAGVRNTEVCPLPTIATNSSAQFNVFVRSTGLSSGATIAGTATVSATNVTNATGVLPPVTILGCGTGCVVAVGTPGDTVQSTTGVPTLANPTKQVVTLPPSQPGAAPIAITVKSLKTGASQPVTDKDLCPYVGKNKCTGQISVIAGNFAKYTDKAHPIRVQIIARWATSVPQGRILMQKPVGPPIQLAPCVKKNGLYNTPCTLPEVIIGSAATHNLMSVSTILFVGSDPHLARRASNTPDAPTAVKATAGKQAATVQWKPPVVTNGRLTGYIVTALLGKTAAKTVAFPASATKGVVKGLTSGKSYTFIVQAKNQRGISLKSIAAKAIKAK